MQTVFDPGDEVLVQRYGSLARLSATFLTTYDGLPVVRYPNGDTERLMTWAQIEPIPLTDVKPPPPFR